MIDGYYDHEYDELDEQIDREIEQMYLGINREWEGNPNADYQIDDPYRDGTFNL